MKDRRYKRCGQEEMYPVLQRRGRVLIVSSKIRSFDIFTSLIQFTRPPTADQPLFIVGSLFVPELLQ